MKPLSTTQAAHRLGISRSLLTELCDSGMLTHWKVPGSKFRRIEVAEVERFAAEHGIRIEQGAQR